MLIFRTINFYFQVSNGPVNSNIPSISNHSVQSGLNKTISSTAKQTSTSTSTSPGKHPPKSQTPNSQQQQSTQPQSQNQQQQQQSSPQPQQQSSVQTQSTKQSSATISNFGQPLTTLANGLNSSIPPTPTTHSISSPLISSPISNQSAITNGNTPNNLSAITQPPSSLSVGVPHPPPATAPTALTPSGHPGLDSAVVSGRTNSPAVATSAVLSAAAPATNGNSNATTVSANGGINAYRTAYPGYPLYTPYSSGPYVSQPVLSSSASPRTVDSRTNRESPLVNSKGIRPITPTSLNNGISTSQTASSIGSQPLNLRELQKTHSPRGHSPNRERDSYR